MSNIKDARCRATWVRLSSADLRLIQTSLKELGTRADTDHAAIRQLSVALTDPEPPPEITVGVYGGLVQWTRGNPIPIRIVDYDGEASDHEDSDDDGHPCTIWRIADDAMSEGPA